MRAILAVLILITFAACNNSKKQEPEKEKTITTMGTLEKYDDGLDYIIHANATVEKIAEGFDWSEGPLWVEEYKMLLFSDVPQNTIYKWTAEKGKEVYLTPSGYTGSVKRGGEMGSNGLALDNEGRLVLCQHGNRQMARMDAPLNEPQPKFITIADKYKGKRFSSPNDAVYNSQGELFFTDPPYGLEKQADDPKKETPWNGVYKVKKDGTVILLVDSISRPNGIILFPGEQQILISSSDPEKPNWYLYDIKGDALVNGKIFHSAAGADKSWKGLPDGLKMDKGGNIFASGPGGIYIFSIHGKKLGLLRLEHPASNCAISADQKTLYITNDMYVLKYKMRD